MHDGGRCLVPAVLLVLLAAHGVSAQAQLAELQYSTHIDLPIVIGGAVVWLASELVLKAALAPDNCRWCAPPGIDRSVRDALKWHDTSLPDVLSGVLAFGLVPAVLVGADALMANHDDAIDNLGPDVLIIAEATVIAMDVNQFVKFIAARQRPFVHALSTAESENRQADQDDNLSFFSGHATGTFALAVATGTVASMRGYRWAPIAWVVGLVLATTTAYLRIAADRHYLTDTLTGAVVGSAFGFTIPYFFHGPRSDRTGITIGMRSSMLVLTGVW
jgi:membrane-associated phospholipid phosphatase